MKVVKYCVATSLVFLMLAGLTWAQEDVDRPRRQKRPDRAGRMQGRERAGRDMFRMRMSRVFRAIQSVELTEEQKQTVEALRVEFTEKIAPLGKALGEKAKAMRERRQNDPDDVEGLKAMRKEMRESFGAIGKAETELIEKVKAVLTEDQVKKLDEALAQRPGGQRIDRALRQLLPFNPRTLRDLELTDEQREKLKTLMENYREDFGKLKTKYEGKFEKLLTDEQKQKLEAAKKTGPGERQRRRPQHGDRERRGNKEGRKRRPRRDDKPEPDVAN